MPEFTRTVSEIEKAYAQYRPENRGFEPSGVNADVLFLLDTIHEIENKTCEWSQVEDYYSNHWETSCSAEFVLEDGAPSDNSMAYCPFCGNKIVEIEPEPPEVTK